MDLRRLFERYGEVEDIDVKRPPPGQGNAYAFIKFLNLDMAHRAKVEMSGQYIGKFQCKIGYGKATPTTRIWVGGLGPWTSLSHLEREFDRFGSIRKIDFVKGDNHAYIQYDSIDAAQAACQEMRGHALGGPDKRLRVDFADPGPYSSNYNSPTRPSNSSTGKTGHSFFSYNLYAKLIHLQEPDIMEVTMAIISVIRVTLAPANPTTQVIISLETMVSISARKVIIQGVGPLGMIGTLNIKVHQMIEGEGLVLLKWMLVNERRFGITPCLLNWVLKGLLVRLVPHVLEDRILQEKDLLASRWEKVSHDGLQSMRM